jgi:hypothetical protein
MEVEEVRSLLISKRRVGVLLEEDTVTDGADGTVISGEGEVMIEEAEAVAVDEEEEVVLKIEACILAIFVGERLASAEIMALTFVPVGLEVGGGAVGCVEAVVGTVDVDEVAIVLAVLELGNITGGVGGTGMRGSSFSTLDSPLLRRATRTSFLAVIAAFSAII